MGDNWFDETPYPGPYESPTFGELFAAFINSFNSAATAISNTVLLVGKQIDKESQADYILSGPHHTVSTLDEMIDEINEKKEKLAFTTADALADVPSGTFEGFFKQFTEAQERIKQREIGRGNVSGHGPRGGRTFGRNGKRRY